ncbi:hypothetical protein FNO01nite_10130 [Flavobacterium noncentrifugens]|nr:hypothetical protein FNO01nite_10130 [Flavobacterium noncentrifugens]
MIVTSVRLEMDSRDIVLIPVMRLQLETVNDPLSKFLVKIKPFKFGRLISFRFSIGAASTSRLLNTVQLSILRLVIGLKLTVKVASSAL